jgi:hypothetical protein
LATGWLISYLKEQKIKWFIVNLAKVEKADQPQGLPDVNLAMYTPKQVAKLYNYRKPFSASDQNYFTSKWNQAALANSHYRILEGEIISVDEDYFDAYNLSHIHSQFESTAKVIGRILRDGEHRISDTTVERNIKKMIDRNLIEYKGDLSVMKGYSIRRK